ncbi:MAG: oxidoreductase [Denitrovibrio sp.]|nr:MAG: oxidoreductase [Denitrovibrio sp.]
MSKKILITGVSKGLGYNLCERFLEAGHNVTGCSRSGSGPAGLAVCEALDVSDMKSVQAFADKVLADFGVPDLLINNAAVMNDGSTLWDTDPDDFKQLMDINVCGTSNVIHAFFPAMLHSGSGIVVNLSSGWGRSTSPNVAPYCASKYAIEGLSLAMAQEVPAGFAVVSLNPGFIKTDMVTNLFGDGASAAEDPVNWSRKAAKYILNIKVSDNGSQMTVA